MNLEELFHKTIAVLNERNLKFALAGGMVASLYRAQPRTTTDLDFLLYAGSESESIAKEIIHGFGLTPFLARQAQLAGGPKFAIKNQSTPVYIVVGRVPNEPAEAGLDFILPQMPWFESAIERAQTNQVDYGFGKIPCLKAEDIVISKFYSLGHDVTRTDDLSDLKSIFEAQKNIDMTYISAQMKSLKLLLPNSFEKLAPPILQRTTKDIRREIRKSNQISF